MSDNKRFIFNMPNELREKVREEAEKSGISMAEVVREACTDSLMPEEEFNYREAARDAWCGYSNHLLGLKRTLKNK